MRTEAQDETFLTAPQLFARWQCSHMFVVDRLRDDPEMPKPTYFGRHRRWRLTEIETYEKILAGRPHSFKKRKTHACEGISL